MPLHSPYMILKEYLLDQDAVALLAYSCFQTLFKMTRDPYGPATIHCRVFGHPALACKEISLSHAVAHMRLLPSPIQGT